MKYFFLTRQENMIAAMINIADMSAGDGGHLDRELAKWLEEFADEIRDIRELVRGSSVAFTRMYSVDRDPTMADVPTTSEEMVASLRIILKMADELAEAKKKLRGDETVHSNPKTAALDTALNAECERFVNGHDAVKKASKGR